MMELSFNVSSTDRKALVQALSEITGVQAKYLGMPTAAYAVDYFLVTKNGSIQYCDSADSEKIDSVIEKLKEKGFQPEYSESNPQQPEMDEPEPLEDCPPPYGVPKRPGLTVTVPIDKVNTNNLTALLNAKGALIQKALGIPAIPFEIHEDCVFFPWFDAMPVAEAVNAYANFICKLCALTINQKRITAKEKNVGNEKYAFRCFLLRLGFIGTEYKAERKILLSKLSGSSAFKEGKYDVSE